MTDPQHPVPAPLWRRLAAMAYDSILVLAIWMVVSFFVLSMFGIENARTVDGDAVTLDPVYKNITLGVMVFSAWAFFGWFWTHSGQTLGMQAWRIKVQNRDGTTISAGQSVIRFGMALVSFLVFGLGYFYMWFNPARETLHDKVSKSVVVRVSLMEPDKDKKK